MRTFQNKSYLYVWWFFSVRIFKFKGIWDGRGKFGPWHMYDNPFDPEIVPVLTITRYIFSFPKTLKLNTALFEGNISTGNIHIWSLISLNDMKWVWRLWGLVLVTWLPIAAGRLYQQWYHLVSHFIFQIYCYVSGVYCLWEDSSIDILSMRHMGISILSTVLLV